MIRLVTTTTKRCRSFVTSTTVTSANRVPNQLLRKSLRFVKFSYACLALIPAGFTIASIGSLLLLQDRNRARALAFYAWTGWLSLPLSIVLFAAAPVSLLFDPVDRVALDYIQRLWARLTLLPFVDLTVEHDENVLDLIESTGKGCIVVSNHRSMLDVYILFAALGIPLHFVSKKEIFFIPLVGWVMGLIGHVSLVRGDRQSGKTVLENCKYYLNNGKAWSVVFFAEGSRSTAVDEKQLGEFKIGAFKLAEQVQAPIVPVTIRGSGEVMPPGKELSCLLAAHQIRVRVHKPIIVVGSAAEKIDAQELKERCWRQIKAGLEDNDGKAL